jgi:hypothetical protein
MVMDVIADLVATFLPNAVAFATVLDPIGPIAGESLASAWAIGHARAVADARSVTWPGCRQVPRSGAAVSEKVRRCASGNPTGDAGGNISREVALSR